MRIEKAFCVELDKIVDIEQAREAYFAQNPQKRFTFLCSDEQCRTSKPDIGVRVSGVNYDKIPAVDEIFKTPHFRQLDAHSPSCYWVEIQEAESLAREHGDRDHHNLIRSLTEKDISVITRFSVPKVSDPSADAAGLVDEEDKVDRIRKIQSRDQRIAAYRALYSGGGSSSRSIETLVSCYETLKAEKALDIGIHVDNFGDYTFKNLFCHVKKINNVDGFHIFYGGAKLYKKRYGKGFKLYFMDKINDGTSDMPLSLYVSNEDANRVTHITKTIDSAQDHPHSYLTVYWIGTIERDDHGLSVLAASFRHLALRFKVPLSEEED